MYGCLCERQRRTQQCYLAGKGDENCDVSVTKILDINYKNSQSLELFQQSTRLIFIKHRVHAVDSRLPMSRGRPQNVAVSTEKGRGSNNIASQYSVYPTQHHDRASNALAMSC